MTWDFRDARTVPPFVRVEVEVQRVQKSTLVRDLVREALGPGPAPLSISGACQIQLTQRRGPERGAAAFSAT
jgi:hypothetical protein